MMPISRIIIVHIYYIYYIKGTIDDADFLPDMYVKELLTNESLEVLMKKDNELIHEIRNLDGNT